MELVREIVAPLLLAHTRESHDKDLRASDAFAVVRPTRVYLLDFFCSGIQFYLLLSPYLCFIPFLYLDVYVLGDDA